VECGKVKNFAIFIFESKNVELSYDVVEGNIVVINACLSKRDVC